MRVRHEQKFTYANTEVVSKALREDSCLAAIVNGCFNVDRRLDHAATLICGELLRRGHHRTPRGRSRYSYHAFRKALVGWPR